MRARFFVALACAISTAGAFSCSDDNESQDTEGLNPQGGSSGSANGSAGNAGSANGGSANGGSSNGGSANGGTGGGQGGSANPGNGGSSNGGSAGSGMGGTMAQGGSAGESGAGGGEGEPDAGPPDDTLGFSEVHPILTANCGNCHGNPNGGLPAFAQANQANAYAVTQANGQQIAERIIVRAVTERSMPPACDEGALGTGACLDVDEAADLETWLDDGALP